MVITSCENNGIDGCSDRKFSGLELAEDVALLNQAPHKPKNSLGHLNYNVRMAFCTLDVQKAVAGLNWLEGKPCSSAEEPHKVERSGCSGSFI